MAKRSLKRLDLDKKLLDRLSKQNMHTCEDVLSLTRLEILKLLGISDKKRKELVDVVSKSCSPKPRTVLEMYEAKRRGASFLSLSIPELDNALGGGLPVGSVTEITGPSGVGKTQFCFMLSVLATLPTSLGGLNGQVIYIDTESTFSAERVMEIAHSRLPEVYSSEEQLVQLMQRIFVYSACTTEALKQILQKMQWDIIRTSAKLVIIDSIASLVRKEFGTAGLSSRIQRSNFVVEQAAILKDLAKSFSIIVVVTNQITSQFQSSDAAENKNNIMLTSDHEHVVPALGITWAHSVNTRFLLQFRSSEQRQLLLAKSPLAPYISVTYTIQSTGIAVSESIEILDLSDPRLNSMQTKYQFLEFGVP